MKFIAEKKNSIIMYLLEQIEANAQDVSRLVAEKCNLSRNTVNKYLNELTEQNIIRKIQRNRYELISDTQIYTLHRSKNELRSEMYVLDKYLEQYITDCTNEAKRIWRYGFSEMVNNVIDHSNAETLTVIVIKNYINTTVLLSDNGVGIFEKIKEHFAFESLDEARCELFKGKLTTDAKNHSGEGIFFTSRMMDEFFIWSSGKFFSNDKYEMSLSLDLDIPNQLGTTVIMRLSNFTHREMLKIFNQFSSVDGGFTSTVMPLKNIFDTALVSRSQAKRICYRLDSFEEVTLDFFGIEWMGQAFAHQMFVLYQNEHPEILLNPINMNDDVKGMYNHVINTK